MTENKEQYLEDIRKLSDRIVQAQRPIRILDEIKWSSDIQESFFNSKFKKLPDVTEAYYQKNPLKFDPNQKKEEFRDLQRDISKKLGKMNKLGLIMQKVCSEYLQVVDMLEARGTSTFSKISQILYGSTQDVFYSGAPSIIDLANIVSKPLEFIKTHATGEDDEKIYTDQEAVNILTERLNQYFSTHNTPIQVKLSDNIVSDAAAGAEYLKIKQGSYFSKRAIRVLEVHEGWVHLGTTINGMNQPICTFLSKGSPSATVTQEGLAVIMEIFTFASHPDRMLGLSNRIEAIHMAEQGANFLQVFEFFRTQGLNEEDSYFKTMRIFRGSTPTEGPFTKDLVYNKGFMLIYNFIRLAVQKGMLHKIPLLFLGKISLEDISTYAELVEEKIVSPPRFLPNPFRDLAALSSWMCYSLFLNKLDLSRLSKEYESILGL